MKMIRNVLLLALILGLPNLAHADSNWVLKASTLTYHVSHPLHHIAGVSYDARGKGFCHAGTCNFLAAVPVKSFRSGDTNRDLHMIEVVRGAEFPMVIVRTQIPEAQLKNGTIHPDLTIQFAGQIAHYSQVPFTLVNEGKSIRVVGTIPATLNSFKIKAPELLAMPISNSIPINVDMTWTRQ